MCVWQQSALSQQRRGSIKYSFRASMSEEKPAEGACEEFNMDFPSEMTGRQWEEHFWAGDFQPWAEGTDPDKLLLKYFDERGAGGRKGLKVFFPMCGTSPDMKWVAGEGHTVVGCEYAEKAGATFAKNMGLTYSETPAPQVDGKVFTYKEKDIKLYTCDIYKFSKELEGQFDIIWDSAAFVAANQKDKQKYADLMKSLLKPDGKLFIYGIEYKDGVIKGPPFSFRDEHCRQFFPSFDFVYIDGHNEPEEHDGKVEDFIHSLRLLTFKTQ